MQDDNITIPEPYNSIFRQLGSFPSTYYPRPVGAFIDDRGLLMFIYLGLFVF